jgi:hypothetical protein
MGKPANSPIQKELRTVTILPVQRKPVLIVFGLYLGKLAGTAPHAPRLFERKPLKRLPGAHPPLNFLRFPPKRPPLIPAIRSEGLTYPQIRQKRHLSCPGGLPATPRNP